MKTLAQKVRDQIQAEGPESLNTPEQWENYIDCELDFMPLSEFLKRISDAWEKAGVLFYD